MRDQENKQRLILDCQFFFLGEVSNGKKKKGVCLAYTKEFLVCCYATVQCVIHSFNIGFYIGSPNPFARFSNKLIGEKNTFI